MWRRPNRNTSPPRCNCWRQKPPAPSWKTPWLRCWARPPPASACPPRARCPSPRWCPPSCHRNCWSAAPTSPLPSAAWPPPTRKSAWRRPRSSRRSRCRARRGTGAQSCPTCSTPPTCSGRWGRNWRCRCSMAVPARLRWNRPAPPTNRPPPPTAKRCSRPCKRWKTT